MVTVNGKKIDAARKYDPETHTLTLDTVTITPADTLEVTLTGVKDGLDYKDDPRKHLLQKLIMDMRMGTRAKSEILGALDELIREA